MPPKATSPPAVPPPDGGWGWAVVFGSFISIGFSYAFPKAITVFFKDIQIIFNASYSEIAWISSIMLAVMYAAGPISSVLVNTYGCRPIVMIGGCLSSLGMILASFCTSVLQLYLCIGVIGGLGLAFNLQPALTMIGRYFYKKRPIANGLAMAGSPVFLSTLAPLNQYLFNQFGWRGSFLILGGLLLNCCVAGSLMRPLGPPPSKNKKDEEIAATTTTTTKEKLTPWLLVNSSVLFETLMDLVGAQRFSSAVGLTTIVECCPVLLGPPLAGKLVDITKNYKYMYFCCGAVVILASIWLFIGNFINYRLLERERKAAEMYKRTETEDPDQGQEKKEADAEAQALQELAAKGPNDEQPMQHETNI
eukprot:XP_011611813.1 PREDICTED: monocarboxylate transporter 2 isoform X2 [Takifugu rubripes]